jgi:hypothetical protein
VPGCPDVSRFVCNASAALAPTSPTPAAYRCGQTAVENAKGGSRIFSGNRL